MKPDPNINDTLKMYVEKIIMVLTLTTILATLGNFLIMSIPIETGISIRTSAMMILTYGTVSVVLVKLLV